MKARRIAALAALIVAAAAAAHAGEPVRTTMNVGPNRNIEAVLFMPDGPGPFPGILVLPTSRGTGPSDEDYARKLARQNYICLVADPQRAHGVTGDFRGMAFSKEATPIFMDLVGIIRGMRSRPKIRPDAIGAIGFSGGGFFAVGLAARHQVNASVAYYPALGLKTSQRLEHMEQNFSPSSAPLLVLHGTADAVIPYGSVENLDKVMTAAGAPHEVKIYQYAGHDFDRLGSQPGNEAAAADAWTRTLAFLKTNLQ